MPTPDSTQPPEAAPPAKDLSPEEQAQAEVVKRQEERRRAVAFRAPYSGAATEQQLKRDEETRKGAAEHADRTEKEAVVLGRIHAAVANPMARQGLHNQDIVKAVSLLRAKKPWEDVKRLMPDVADAAMEGWRKELERRAALPPGGERVALPKSGG